MTERFAETQISELNEHMGANRASLMGKLTEEIREVFDAPRFSPEMYKELPDLIIVCIGLMIHAGYDVPKEIDDKLELAREKYKDVPMLKELGMKHTEAIRAIKDRWTGK